MSAVPLRYSSAATTTKLLENFATKQGAIRVDAAHNMILIQGTGPERRTAVETVLSFDNDSVGRGWPDRVAGRSRSVSTASATGTQRNPEQDAQRHSVARSTSQLSRQRIFPSEQDDGTHRTHHFHPAAGTGNFTHQIRNHNRIRFSVHTVRGIHGLRVIDASILPDIPSAPTNVTTIMVAERIATKLAA